MSRGLKVIAAVAIGFLCVAWSGCAQIAANRALKQYKEALDPAVGVATKDHYIQSWGPPQSTTPIADGEVCVWRFSYGTRAFAGGSQYAVNASAHEMYDKLTLTFDRNNVLRNWNAWSQR